MIHVESVYAPAIFTAPVSGKTYVVPTWLEVPTGTTLNDIDWIRPVMVKPSMITKHVGKYILNIHSNGKITCDCPGYTFRKKCKHVEAIKNVTQETNNDVA